MRGDALATRASRRICTSRFSWCFGSARWIAPALLLLAVLQSAEAQGVPPPTRVGPNRPLPATTKTAGKFRLAAFLPESAGAARVRAGFVFAVDLINNDTSILPQHLLEPLIFSVGVGSVNAPQQSVQLLEHSLTAVIGPTTSSVAKPAAFLLRPYRLVQISPAATDPELSQKSLYDGFLRNIPSDVLQGPALARTIVGLGWRACGVLYADDSYGQNIAKSFITEAQSIGLRVGAFATFSDASPDKTPQLLTIKAASVFVIAVFSGAANQSSIFESAERVGMLAPEYIFLGGDGLTAGPRGVPHAMLQGALGLQPETQAATPQTASFLDRWAAQNSSDYLGAGVRVIDVYPALTVDAVYMVARALHSLLAEGAALNGSYARVGERAAVPFGAQLKGRIISSPIEGISGGIALDANGDRVAPFVLVQYDGGAWKRVARFTFAGGLEPKEPPIAWRGGLKPYDGSCAAGSSFAVGADGSPGCRLCPAGAYSQLGFRECRPCPAGSYSASPGSDRCVLCSPGTAAGRNGSSACEACGAGSFAAAAGAVACAPCERGTYENRAASVECTRADVDEYVPAPASLRPVKCPANSRTNRLGSYNISECTCTEGHFSIAPIDGVRFTTCFDCVPEGGTCDGGPFMRVQEGYWRLPWDYSTLVRCENGGCLGGLESSCATGYEGVFCSTCGAGYGVSNNYNCQFCASPSASAGILLGGLLGYVVLAAFLSYSAIRSSFSRASQITIVLRLLIDHLQFNNFVQSIQLRWPNLLTSVLSFSSAISDPVAAILSVDCVMASADYPRDRVYFLKAAGYLVLPAMAIVLPVFAVSVIAWATYFRSRSLAKRDRAQVYDASVAEAEAGAGPPAEAPGEGGVGTGRTGEGAMTGRRNPRSLREMGAVTARKVTRAFWPEPVQPATRPKTAEARAFSASWADYYIVCALVSMFLIQPSVSSTVLDLFRCKTLTGARSGLARSFVRGSMNTECLSGEHVWWLLAVTIPGIPIVVVGIPLAGSVILWHCRGSRLQEPRTCFRYSFLFEGYKPRYFYFEIVQIYRKLFLVLVSVFMADQPEGLAFVVLAFFISTAGLDLFVMPFEDRLVNGLNLASVCINLFTMFCGMVFQLDTLTNSSLAAVAVILAFANFLFFAGAGVVLLRAVLLAGLRRFGFLKAPATKERVYRLLRYSSITEAHVAKSLQTLRSSESLAAANEAAEAAPRGEREREGRAGAAVRKTATFKGEGGDGEAAVVSLTGFAEERGAPRARPPVLLPLDRSGSSSGSPAGAVPSLGADLEELEPATAFPAGGEGPEQTPVYEVLPAGPGAGAGEFEGPWAAPAREPLLEAGAPRHRHPAPVSLEEA
eukprot:tig00001250_g7795.t1